MMNSVYVMNAVHAAATTIVVRDRLAPQGGQGKGTVARRRTRRAAHGAKESGAQRAPRRHHRSFPRGYSRA